MANPNLSIDLVPGGKRSLTLRNPVMTASGTFGNGLEYQRIFDIQRLGAIVSKAITRKPRRGNVQPRIAETAAGMINSIGLQNIGIDAILRDVAPVWATWDVPVSPASPASNSTSAARTWRAGWSSASTPAPPPD
jgi:dihydroorotate dehydrogenase (NAD+) catalytic subunit